MLRPNEFIDLARLLARTDHGDLVEDAQMRRSVSTSYYALFHTVLTAAAERLFGAGEADTAGYAILYRTFNHGTMKQVCDGIARGELNLSLRQQLRRSSVHSDLRDFAISFVDLQARRQQADYDPYLQLSREDAETALDIAERAIAAFHRAPVDERADVLALMLGGGRK